MNQNTLELVLILDKSGSMSGLENDTIGGFNSMIEKEKKEQLDVLVTTVLFNDRNELVHDRVKISEVKPLTEREYFASGCTALLDAVGSTIKRIEEKHKELGDEAPAKTLVVITTDGYENASSEYKIENIKSLIESKKTCGWDFIFLAANMDAVSEASKLGIDRNFAADYSADKKGTKANFDAVYCAAQCKIAGNNISPDWKKKIVNTKTNK